MNKSCKTHRYYNIKKNNIRVILNDFGAILDLRATKIDNSSVNNHYVMYIFFMACNWRRITYINKETRTNDETVINDCDKWVFFIDTISKGKNNDHVFHDTCLEYIINFYNT